jgi:hypothetical protein
MIDLDALAELLRQLLGSGNGIGPDTRLVSNLLSERFGAIHVVGRNLLETGS